MGKINIPQLMIGGVFLFLAVVVGVKYLISDAPPDIALIGLVGALATALVSTAAYTADQSSKAKIEEERKRNEEKTMRERWEKEYAEKQKGK